MVVEGGGLRNPSPCARLAVARPRPLSSEFSPGAGAQSSQAAPGAGPAETGCRGEHPAGRRAGGREQPQERCPRPPPTRGGAPSAPPGRPGVPGAPGRPPGTRVRRRAARGGRARVRNSAAKPRSRLGPVSGANMASPSAPRAPGCQARRGRLMGNTLGIRKGEKKNGGGVGGGA
ncbi:unnamed protein product [Rangifer tarandus platyrhynchus]|uniref:Uncharacterized protein n=2 Tax=Rangifer tarandus platyrhynchus TaxID=3082113 RepID=A0ABN8YCT1_RANTA|nr:unnamed protein product [Rangifer tarandus platyrhynchus]CAI9696624.1 unnamed protein product [Rangifer tarandus platyrhynchus]